MQLENQSKLPSCSTSYEEISKDTRGNSPSDALKEKLKAIRLNKDSPF